MPTYQYTAIDDHGRKIEGTEYAETEKELETKLAMGGYYLLSAEEIKSPAKVSPHRTSPSMPPYISEAEGRKADTSGVSEVHYHQHVHYGTAEGVAGGEKGSWSDMTLWIILWLIFFCPVGLYLVWKKEHIPMWFKITISAVIGLGFIGSITEEAQKGKINREDKAIKQMMDNYNLLQSSPTTTP